MAKTINMECPICKKKVLFVGVHDDEGNYHGLVGCEYENDPWSGLSYALHHDGWGDCPLCTDGAYSAMGGMLFDRAEDAISALTPPNEPLTLDELREMDGEPVWAVLVDEKFSRLNGWYLVHHGSAYLARIDDWELDGDKYGVEWLAYRRPLEGDADA